MKKKNFLRNLSTTALAMCCLSSAIAFTSYASFEENLGNISWLFEEEEEIEESESDEIIGEIILRDTIVPNEDGNFEKRDIKNKIKFKMGDSNKLVVTEVPKTDNNKIVVIPKIIPAGCFLKEPSLESMKKVFSHCNSDLSFEITKIGNNVDFSGVASLLISDSLATFNESGKLFNHGVKCFCTFKD